MYHDHFGLQDSPFTIAPDPRFLFMSNRHREALAHLLFGIRSEGGFVLLTGEVGTGKTTVCRCLLEQLPVKTQVACILNPRLSVTELLATLCDELHIPYPEGNQSIKVFIDRLNGFLLDSHAQGRSTVLIIDEAQNLSIDVLEQVRLLTNLETSRRKLLQIILLGQPELRDKLSRPELRQLRQRVTASYHLEALTRGEAAEYIRHRLAVAGLRRPLFTNRAIGRIYRLSGGIPRRINLLCDRALLGAYTQGLDQVSAGTVGRAARELEMARGVAGPFLPVARTAAALVLIMAAGLAFAPWSLNRDESVAPAAQEGRIGNISSVEPPAATEPNQPIEPIEPTEPMFRWPDDLSPARSKETAYQALLAAWGIAYDPGAHGSACDFAEQNGLGCLHRRGSLGSLRLLDRPAVLSLRTDGGENLFATLRALPEGDNKPALFIFDGKIFPVPVRELERRWFGEYTLIWRKPPFNRNLRTGDRGPEIDWLARRLAAALGHPAPTRSGLPLKGEILEHLKAFQLARGLEPDGLVGPNTLIHLDSALGSGSPRLTGSAEEI